MKHSSLSRIDFGVEVNRRFALRFRLAFSVVFAIACGFGMDATAQTGAPSKKAEPAPEVYRLAKVSGNRVNVRVGPSSNHFRVFALDLDTPVIVTRVSGEWAQIMMPVNQRCWIISELLEIDTAKPRARSRVLGTAVNLRAAANTRYSVIGQVGPRSLIFPTGRTSRDGKWVEVFAPLEARLYMHRDYLEMSSRMSAAQARKRWPSLLAPGELPPAHVKNGMLPDAVPTPSGASDRTSGVTAKIETPNAPVLPSVVSPRLRKLHAKLNAELAKEPEAWNFNAIQAELLTTRRNSEDTGEARLAELWFEYIEENYVPIVETLARGKQNRPPEGPVKPDKPIEIGPLPKASDKFLAKGWVVGMGKNSKVGGTHKLMKGNRLLFYLKSDTIDLDRLMYKRISIQGTIQERPPSEGARLIKVTGFKVLSN